MFCNHAFYFGATAENYSTLEKLKDLKGAVGLNFLQVHQQETYWLIKKKI